MLVKARNIEISVDAGPLVVGVINATPDSFSDVGDNRSLRSTLARAQQLVTDGADVLEVGGESNVSNRPPVTVQEEIERVVPVIERISTWGKPVSVDTYKPAVAEAALDAGALIINDISGFADPAMVELVGRTGAAAVIVHTEVPPKTSRWDSDAYPDGVLESVMASLTATAARLMDAGAEPSSVILDPGPDFAKTPEQTTTMLVGLGRIVALEHPVMLAASRKDFIGALTGRPPRERLGGSLAAVGAGALAGVHFVRAHDVAETRDFITVWRALQGQDDVSPELRLDEAVRREAVAASYETDGELAARTDGSSVRSGGAT